MEKMIEIPDRLKDKNINFVLIEKGGKRPFQLGWQNKQIRYDDEDLLSHLKLDGNYGVIGGGEKNLLIVDFDNKEVQESLLPKLPKTYTVKTGSKLLHLYFFSNKKDSYKIFDEDMNTLADVQGEGKQVVGANSIHPNGNKYEVINDVPIAFIDYAELKANLMFYDKKPRKQEIKINKDFEETEFTKLCKSKIKIKDVLNKIGISISKNPTECPFHYSVGGKCLGFTDEICHCFHCDESWNIFSLVKQYKNCGFSEALDFLADNFGLKKELKKSKEEYKIKKQKEHTQQITLLSKFSPVPFAEKLMENNRFVYDKFKRFWRYDEKAGVWKEDAGEYIRNQLRVTLVGDEQQRRQYIDEIVNYIRDLHYNSDYDPELEINIIPFENCLFDLETGELIDFSPEHFVTNKIPIKLDSSCTECDAIDQFFADVVGEEYKEILYELVAYCLYRGYPYQKLFFLVGSGANGKSTFLELLRNFVGQENVSSVSPHSLVGQRFVLGSMWNKLVNISSDLSYEVLRNVNRLKEITGGDTVSVERKFKEQFPARLFAKQIFSTNQLPIVNDKTQAWYRRVYLIEFPNRFDDPDPFILNKLVSPKQLSGLAWKCIKYLKALQKDNFRFKFDVDWEKLADMYEQLSNPLIKFLTEETQEDPEGYIFKFEFNKALLEWLKSRKFRVWTEREIGLQMRQRFEEGRRSKEVWDKSTNQFVTKQYRAWLGVNWGEGNSQLSQDRHVFHIYSIYIERSRDICLSSLRCLSPKSLINNGDTPYLDSIKKSPQEMSHPHLSRNGEKNEKTEKTYISYGKAEDKESSHNSIQEDENLPPN